MVRPRELLAKLELEDLNLILRERIGAVRTQHVRGGGGGRGAGRLKLTWEKLTKNDCCEWKVTTVDPQKRSTWRSGVRSAMLAAGQLSGRGLTDVDDAPAPACYYKTDYDMMMNIQ